MPMGASSSAGDAAAAGGAGGGMAGMSALGSIGSSGGMSSGAALAGSGAAPAAASGIDWGAILSNPEFATHIGEIIKSFGNFTGKVQGAPAEVQSMMKQLVHQGGSVNTAGGIGPQENALNPYGGDMTKYITPEMARGVLDSHGVPYGRM